MSCIGDTFDRKLVHDEADVLFMCSVLFACILFLFGCLGVILPGLGYVCVP